MKIHLHRRDYQFILYLLVQYLFIHIFRCSIKPFWVLENSESQWYPFAIYLLTVFNLINSNYDTLNNFHINLSMYSVII